MTEELYTKSKALGFDYIKDRGQVPIKPQFSYYEIGHEFNLNSELDGTPFDKEKYLEVCESMFSRLEAKISDKKKQTIVSGTFDTSYSDDGTELKVLLYRYETEDEFIKRKQKNEKARLAKLKTEELAKSKRKTEVKESLKKMTPEEIQEAIKGVKGLTYNG